MSANDELQAHTCEKMLEFYGDVANNVVQPEMQDLTEQWKNGELPYGKYYVKNIYGNVVNDIYRDNKYDEWVLHSDREICKILSPVPSYEEWLGTKVLKEIRGKGLSILQEGNNELAKENQHLKNLLREWMHFYPIILYEHEDTLKTKDIVELFDKTREVLK